MQNSGLFGVIFVILESVSRLFFVQGGLEVRYSAHPTKKDQYSFYLKNSMVRKFLNKSRKKLYFLDYINFSKRFDYF